jgi:hypothetical protein
MRSTRAGTTIVAIMGRIMDPDGRTLSAAGARAILDLDFKETDKERVRELSAKAREGTLSPEEQAELNNYELADQILAVMMSRARRALKTPAATKRKAKAH